MPSVLISPREVAGFASRYEDVFARAGVTVKYPPPAEANILTPAELLTCLKGIDAVVAGSEAYTPAVFAACPQLKVVARVGVGYDSVDIPGATEAGVAITVAPGTNHECVAEHAFALILSYSRLVVTRTNLIRAGGWPRHYSKPLRGHTIGLVGLGRIGKAVAVRAAAFGMKVLAYDPLTQPIPGVELVGFDELLARSDYVSLHMPLTPETRHTMTRARFAQMKPGAVLVNTSRGGLVDEAALLEVLKSGHLGGALLDVLEQEPPPTNHPLFQFDNVLLTPHAAGVDLQSLGDMARSASEAVVSILAGDWPAEKVVNPLVRPRLRR